MVAITPTQSNAQAALANFLAFILPGEGPPAVFAGTISGTALNVTKMISGSIAINTPLLGAAPDTLILAHGTGTGGLGTYTLSQSQSVPNSTTFSTGVTIISGQQNRISEPANPYFLTMTPILFERLETNIDTPMDVRFTGSIAGNVLTVTAINFGAILPMAVLSGVNVAAGSFIVQQLTGMPGSTGTYTVSQGQTLSSQVVATGAIQLKQCAKITVQLDFHSPDTLAGDFAQTVSTAFRDDYAVQFFAEQAIGNFSNTFGPTFYAQQDAWIIPFYADDPKQVPFINDAGQYEWRWSVDACLELDQIVAPPQQFMDSAKVTVIEVAATYPAT